MSKLDDAGLVTIEKSLVRRKPRTTVALTATGRRRIADHWERLERLRSLSETP